tara:strand:+ start:997 stop:1206 length:210 start_codon:yes stop_codon:yes gene_type:complete
MKFLIETFKRLTIQHPKSQLGRWNLVSVEPDKRCEKSLELIIRQANMDNCGDKICGLPKYIKNNSLKNK